MTRILVRPDQLRTFGAQLQRVSGDLQAVEGRVGNALGGLAWEARQKAGVDGQANQARSQARTLAAQAEEMGRYLQRKAQTFEEADGQGAASLHALPPRDDLPWWWPPQMFLPVEPPPWLKGLLPGWNIEDILRGVLPILPIFIALPVITLPLLPRPSWFLSPKPAPQPEPVPEPVPTPTPTPPGPPEHHPSPQPTPVQPPKTGPAPVPLNHKVKAEDYNAKDGCAKYALSRRPDLGATGGKGGAADYITKFKDKVFQVTDPNTDLQDKIATGYAIVWPRGHPSLKRTAGETYGHVAIVEEVGPDYVVVSQAGWGKKTRMKIPREQLASLYVIP